MNRFANTPTGTSSHSAILRRSMNGGSRGAPWRLISLAPSLLAFHLAGQSALLAQGLVYLSPEAYDSIPAASAPLSKAPLPARMDLSRNLPPPGAQGLQASCVGWAVAYGLKTYQESVERGRGPTGPMQMFSPAFIYNRLVRGNCRGFTHIRDALEIVASDGVAPLSVFPYDPNSCSRLPDRRALEVARDYRVSSYTTVNDINGAKAQLANGFPIVIGMDVGSVFQEHGSGVFHGEPGYSNCCYGHAMLVVGYDDGMQAFRVFNSWGREWGDNGYGWISYRAYRNQVREAYVARDMSSSNATVPPREREETSRRASGRMSAVLDAPVIAFDRPIRTPVGVYPGISIRVPGRVLNAGGRSAQVVLRFFNRQNGAPLQAPPAEYTYRDARGGVATGTDPFSLASGDVNLSSMDMGIPYGALNLRPTNFRMRYHLMVKATLYVDDWLVAESEPTPLTVQW